MKIIPWARIEALMARGARTQAWLAGRLNIAPNVVTNWKRRGGAPVARAQQIARAFSVALDDIVGRGGDVDLVGASALRLVERVREMDRRGLLTQEAETAMMAVMDLIERAVERR